MTVGARVREMREKAGLSQSELARRIGIKPQSIQALEVGKVQKGKHLKEIAETLGADYDYLLTGLGKGARQSPPPGADNDIIPPQPKVTLPRHEDMPQDVPVMGTARGGAKGAFQLDTEGTPVDYAPRWPGIMKARDVYVIRVVEDSMYPAFEEGDPAYVDPNKPPKIGDYVVIQEQNNDSEPVTASIKKLLKRDDNWLQVKQFNPEDTFKIKTGQIKAVHTVLRLKDLMGV